MSRGEREELLTRLERLTEPPLLILALALIPLLVLPFIVNLPGEIEQVFLALDWSIWAVFALDLGARTYLARSRLRYLRHHWFDVVIVALPMLRPLRVLRVVKALYGAGESSVPRQPAAHQREKLLSHVLPALKQG